METAPLWIRLYKDLRGHPGDGKRSTFGAMPLRNYAKGQEEAQELYIGDDGEHGSAG